MDLRGILLKWFKNQLCPLHRAIKTAGSEGCPHVLQSRRKMADNEQKAEQLVVEAEKKLNAKPFLGKSYFLIFLCKAFFLSFFPNLGYFQVSC